MQRHVWFRPLDPAVVTRRDVEQVAGPEGERLAVVHDDAAPSRDDEPDVLDLTALGPRDGADVRGPLPPRVIAGAPDGEGTDPHEIELSLLEAARSEEHTSELQSPDHLVCRLLLEKKKNIIQPRNPK